jgi:ditrans,polycis-polyprenyl diphosphate synthase
MGGLASRFASSGTCSSAQTRFRRATCAVLRAGGPTPKHVAIVMDGNRRFAKSRSLHRARGHEHGADKLVDVLEWCLALGVEALSVYAFSTDNLKRDAEEKAGLFALAEARLLEIAASDVIREKKVRVRVVGDVFREANEIPESLRVAAAKVTAMTWHHSGPVLNVCFAYTGREDIAQAVGALGAAKNAGVVADSGCHRRHRRAMPSRRRVRRRAETVSFRPQTKRR